MVEILNHHGKPIRKKDLEEPQTAQIAQLYQEFSGHPTRGLTPGRIAQIMEQAEQGDLIAQCDLFEDMEEKDAHISAELGKRKRAILGVPWAIDPPRNASAKEKKVAETIQDIILGIPDFEDVLFDMADGIGYGYSCLEYEWEMQTHWKPKSITHRPPRWFTVNQESRNQLVLRDNSPEGAELWPAGWITHRHKSKSGELARSGLHRALAWPFLYKNYSVRDLAEFLEIYGLPVRLGTYPRAATASEKTTLLRAVLNMGHAAAGIVPEGMMIEFKEAAKGNSDPFEAMIAWCERSQSKAILGGTLTSQADGASSTNALGNVHNEVRHDILVSDARQIASTLTRDLVFTLCQLNGLEHDPSRCPKFAFDLVEPEDMALYADAIPKLVAVGMPIPVSYVGDKLRIPAPVGNEPILGIAPANKSGSVALKAVTSIATERETLPTASQTDQLAIDAAATQNDWLAVLKAKVDAAESLEALRDDLLNSYGDLETDTLANIMAIGFASAELAGRFDVDQE